MNIKQHIEAGHYPTDTKGRALVPMHDGKTFVVCATDHPSQHPIFGFVQNGPEFDNWGAFSADAAAWLLPPPPRKVKVTRYALVCGGDVEATYRCKIEAQKGALDSGAKHPVIVELTGEYEEPWS